VPQGLRYNTAGNLYFADSNNHVVRMVTPQGVIRTVAGTGSAGFGRDNGPATQAQLNTPTDVAFDNAGNLLIADSRNHRIRRVAAEAFDDVGEVNHVGKLKRVTLFLPAPVRRSRNSVDHS